VIRPFGSIRGLGTENAGERAAQRLSRSIRGRDANPTFESPKEVSSEIALFFLSN